MKMVMALLLSSAMTAQASIITNTFEAIVFDGTFAGQIGTGEFSYDDQNLDVDLWTIGFPGSSFVDFEDLISFSFTFLGQTYLGSDDSNFPDTPTLDIFDFVPDYLDFFVEDNVTVDIVNPLIEDFQLVGVLDASNNGFDFVVDMFVTERVVNNVSSPNMSSLILLFLTVYFFRKRTSGIRADEMSALVLERSIKIKSSNFRFWL